MKPHRSSKRSGAVLVLLVVSLVALMSVLALAIDLGMLAVARTQLQDAADAAAMAGARTLNGNTSTNNNYSNATPNAVTAATTNTVLSQNVQSSNATISIGRYTYNSSTKQFEGQFPGSSGNWSMVRAQISANIAGALAFSKVFNFSGTTLSATATAAHRPRDIMIILDYSGSMRFASLVGDPYSGNRTSNNNDSIIPQFGHYSSGSAGLQATTFTSPYDAANITATTSDGRAPIVQDFYTDTAGTPAFTAASSSYQTTPAGDNFKKLNKDTGASYCTTAADLLNIGSVTSSTRDATFETQGYKAYGMSASFNGYTQGPGYWGKTFWIWPPDPTNDWRSVYFGTTDNSKLYDSSGNWLTPSAGGYTVNYTAILNFIKNVGPSIFPSQLESGRVVYYTSIPSSISGYPPADLNQRFWKDYIDYVLGAVQTGGSSWLSITDGNTGLAGYGFDFAFGTTKITATSSLSGSPKPYMYYKDNPLRPGMHFWFGPLSMIDFLGNYNMWYQISPSCSRFCWWPGTCHESPLYACKLGIRAALTDIQTNHPNDLVSLAMFSTPMESSGDGGRFNRVRVGLSNAYQDMQDSLWYPPNTIGSSATSSTVTPYDSNNLEIPRAMGGTCYAMGLMQAYNQFSANTTLVNYNPGASAGDAGGNGRKGAQKIIIFETDGAPNTTASATLTNGGAYNSYYAVRYNSSSPGSSEFPTSVNGYSDNASTVTSQINTLCNQICALDTASPPGYSSTTKKALIHCIGFGPQFSGANASANLATLNAMQTIGSVTDGMPSYKVIYGSESTVTAALQQAFTQILQTGVQVSLIQ